MQKIVVIALCLGMSAPVVAAGFKEVSRDGRYVEYQGDLRLSGRFERQQDSITLDWRGDRVCFYPDAVPAKLLPRVFPTNKPAMFCFSNTRTAINALGLPPEPPEGACGMIGTATVSISRYVVENGMGETYDLATFVSAENVSTLKPVPCP
ncbi:MAG: hypothetical protein IT466_11025 [Moraxellaceae bacterium]|jgi:hypothetical protein|nr:hypothetical protein [Moraxellaceae bacterium]MBP7230094.1 hypothetical protein [Moraxellaceae bacterium]MBP8852469.1 hypothetical protein [Moraxellaceae bacterium]MBP9045681.1 hypothetical protein [Moraxellaceae bacterium]MBP9730758.1 hypothetical protein [Moraxellaceae bacterium]